MKISQAALKKENISQSWLKQGVYSFFRITFKGLELSSLALWTKVDKITFERSKYLMFPKVLETN